MVTAIVAAGGMGVRMGANKPKALLEVAGYSLLEWTLRSLEASGVPSRTIIVAPEQALPQFSQLLERTQGSNANIVFTSGGASRQASVANALALVDDDPVVLIHDAARCFAPPSLIRRVASLVDADHPAVVPGMPVTDTIRLVKDEAIEASGGDVGTLERTALTPSRGALRAIQTPQGFMTATIKAAHEQFANEGASEAGAATDDAQLVEWMGLPSYVCRGDADAFKVTTSADLARAMDRVRDGIEWLVL